MGRNENGSQVAIIGAGPYGLAAAAHLRAAGVETRIFGEPMEFWERHMPRGMLLRSSPKCSSIGDPDGALTLDHFHAQHGSPPPGPLPLDDFVRYGHWFQKRVAEDLDRRRVTLVERAPRGFRLRLEDGEQLEARRVVVATGIGPFARRPPEFDGLPAELASHSSTRAELGQFAGRRVVVVGGGQSALEAAALLHEGGAEVEVIARAPALFWLKSWRNTDGAPALVRLSTWARRQLQPIVRPKLDIMGPRFVTWLVAWPRLFRSAPIALQRRLTAAAVRPAGASWLVPRLAEVRLTTGRTVVAARPAGAQLSLRLDDGTGRRVDHLLLATGYRVDVRRYGFLSQELRVAVRVREGYPELGKGFEASVPGLHFVGAAAADTFGPIYRFVVGSRHAARTLTRHVVAVSSNGSRRGNNLGHAVFHGGLERVANAG